MSILSTSPTPVRTSPTNPQVSVQLPEQLQESLPTVERLQQELNEAAAEIEAKSSNPEE